jgi:hypothetical protein
MRHINHAKARRKPGEMNPNEAAYNRYLTDLQAAGQIQWFKFEGYKFKLADNTTYTPDFAVMLNDGTLEFHDTKGRTTKKRAGGKVETYWCMEDAKIKMKVVADIYPHPFRAVWLSKDGSWKSEEI